MPEGKSTRQLSRKPMHGIHLHSVSSLRREEGNMSAAMKHSWARNRSKDEGTANSSYTGQGAWLRATPGTAANTISKEAFHFNLGHRLGLNAPGAGQACRRALRLGQGPTCQGRLDVLGLHAAACARPPTATGMTNLETTLPNMPAQRESQPPSSRHGLPMMLLDMPVPCTRRTWT